MKRIPKKLLFIIAGAMVLVCAGYFVWQKIKYRVIRKAVSVKVYEATNGLYTVTYDSLAFDEITGNATIRNIRVKPDTNRVKSLSVENMPDILLDVSIPSLTVSGAKTAKALQGKKIEGDSVVISHPQIILYSLKPLQKGTKIEFEANSVYKNILGKLDLVKVGFVYVNNVNVKGIDFFTKEKNFDFINGKILLEDVLIDSAHNLDTSRILFCRQAAFTVDSFFSYNHNRRALSVRDVNFLGKQKQLLFGEISIDRFTSDTSSGIRLLDASTLKLAGVHTNEIVKNKNLSIDSIQCRKITFYELPLENLKTTKGDRRPVGDTTGFSNVYGVYMKYLHFPEVAFVPFAKSAYTLGNISIRLKTVQAGQIASLETHPMDFTREAEVAIDRFTLRSKDGSYHFDFRDILINSLQKQLQIRSFDIIPRSGEKEFAAGFHFQRDRYEVRLSGISLGDIDMNSLIDKHLSASALTIRDTRAVIYRDLHKPLEKKSKVGNYPSQLLAGLDFPVHITKASLLHAYIAYRENEEVSDSIGVVSFSGSKLNISNITNVPDSIRENNKLHIGFTTRALGEIPLKGDFTFILGSPGGNFMVNGQTPAFDASLLNRISIPMGLIKVNSGKIASIDFHLRGNNTSAGGDFVMKYDGLKIDVLKRDKGTREVRKRGLASLAANAIVKNSNPGDDGLRKVSPEYDRDIYKSFFNLVWKTIFTGMKQTAGL